MPEEKRTDGAVMKSDPIPPHALAGMKKNCLDAALFPDRSIITYVKGTRGDSGCVVTEYLSNGCRLLRAKPHKVVN